MSTKLEVSSKDEIPPKTADDHNNEEESELFGEFLTSQYELLKRTLSHLLINDLGRAALVCNKELSVIFVNRSWNKAATHVLKERELNAKIRWYLQCNKASPCDRSNCCRNDIKFRSQMILGFQLARVKRSGIMSKISFETDTAKGKKIPGLTGPAFLITCDGLRVPDSSSNEYSDYGSAALFIPHSVRFKILSSVCFNEDSLQDTIRAELDLQYGPLQGLLVFAKDWDTDTFTLVYNRLCHRFRRSIPLAGGIFPAVQCLESGQWNSLSGVTLVLSFHGQVDCYAGILSGRKRSDIEPFMKKMRGDLGEIDFKKMQRTAMVIRCVGRANSKLEDDMFRKYFPDTPAFVLKSCGEYGNPGDSSADRNRNKIPATTNEICYSYCTIYFIFTINLPP